ncbi:MAG: galactose mutarotase [Gammaproteobacteria bacterium]|nr:galactose mutarotase [Gammaproteobacteria bacterium]MXY51158.1 galactose mutarotase [Gammaproteobacteria bacterium]
MTIANFGAHGGQPVRLFTLTNESGAQVQVTEYGGIVVRIRVPDREGRLGDVALGFDSLDAYVAANPFFGTITGRYANRIAGARFELDGVAYGLARNNGAHSLHGGVRGFDKVVWRGEPTDTGDGVAFTYISPDGEEGYPGTLTTTVTYTWSDANELRIDYRAETDRATVVNLTNHSYFNLADGGAGSVLDHEVTIHAERYTPADDEAIPTGEIASVEKTPFDFRHPRTLGERIDAEHPQMRASRGYDVNYVLDGGGGALTLAATVFAPKSGRAMDVLTDQPGVQLYTGNHLDGSLVGIGGIAYPKHSGLCLETQHFPNSPNEPSFPSTVLRPGQVYETTTVYRFRTHSLD